MSTNALRCAIPTIVIGTQALGKRVSNAVSSGRRKSTKPMRNIRSMCRDIEWRDGDKGQIPGKRIEPQRPLLDTLIPITLYPTLVVGHLSGQSSSQKIFASEVKIRSIKIAFHCSK